MPVSIIASISGHQQSKSFLPLSQWDGTTIKKRQRHCLANSPVASNAAAAVQSNA